MIDHLQIVKNFITESINEPDKIIDDIHIVTEDYEMNIFNKSANGYIVSYKTHRDFTTMSMTSKLSKLYKKNPLTISNKIVHRPKNLIILGSFDLCPIYFKDCVFLCHAGFESISICEDCVFVG